MGQGRCRGVGHCSEKLGARKQQRNKVSLDRELSEDAGADQQCSKDEGESLREERFIQGVSVRIAPTKRQE